MGKLVYSAITSLDGYVADVNDNFDWAMPSAELHAFVNDLERPIGTYLYGRRMYEVMRAWETMGIGADESPEMRDYAAIWRAADKVVYSTTLETVVSAHTRIERAFDADAVRAMKVESETGISIGGPALAAHAIRAGLVDELHLFAHPVVVGGGNPALPDGVVWKLDLVDQGRFADGVVHLHYRAATDR